MLAEIPNSISLLFGIIVIISIFWFYKASHSTNALILLTVWAILMTAVGLSGFLPDFETMPPRFLVGVVPPVLLIFFLFITRKGKAFIDQINLSSITYFSVIRIPVEITLALLYHHSAVSILQTFEGANFDILSGMTASVVAYLVFTKKKLGQPCPPDLEYHGLIFIDYHHRHIRALRAWSFSATFFRSTQHRYFLFSF